MLRLKFKRRAHKLKNKHRNRIKRIKRKISKEKRFRKKIKSWHKVRE